MKEKKYASFVSDILKDVQRSRRIKELGDEDLSLSDKASIRERNEKYTDYIQEYTYQYSERANLSLFQKKCFFWFSIATTLIVVGGGITAIVLLARRENITIEALAAIVTAFAAVITAALALPSIIASHLFPQREDDKSAHVFEAMVKGDMDLRKMYLSEQPKERTKDQ